MTLATKICKYFFLDVSTPFHSKHSHILFLYYLQAFVLKLADENCQAN